MSQLYTPHSLEKGLKVLFLKHFGTEASLAARLCHIEPSDSDAESYDWLGQSPTMSEFISERKNTPLSNAKYSITNKTWESTVTVSRNDLADNKTGSINRRIQQMAAVASGHANSLIISALESGTSDLAYDGIAMFSDSHTARADEGSTQDNLLAGSGTSTAQVGADFATAKAEMLKFKGENGEPFHPDGVGQLVVVCPPDMEKAFRETLNAGLISGATGSASTNVQLGAADLIVSPRLTDADDWYLLRTDSVRSMIFQDREAMEFASLEAGSDTGFNSDSWSYGVRARYNVGYGFWQCAVKTVN